MGPLSPSSDLAEVHGLGGLSFPLVPDSYVLELGQKCPTFVLLLPYFLQAFSCFMLYPSIYISV